MCIVFFQVRPFARCIAGTIRAIGIVIMALNVTALSESMVNAGASINGGILQTRCNEAIRSDMTSRHVADLLCS